MAIEIYGAVIVAGRIYEDNAIARLVGAPVDGWTFAGDQGEDESNILISENDAPGDVFDTLPEALAFLSAQKGA